MPVTQMLLWPDGAPGAKGNTIQDKPDLTLYMPDDYDQSKPRGLVVILPGGGYHFKAQHEGEPIALWLNAHGIPAAVVQYRVSPYRYPYPAEDARRAIRLVRANAENWHVDPNHVAILGFSAGGHCATTAATIHESQVLNPNDPVDAFSSRPDAFIPCYAVINLENFRHDGSLHCLLDDATGHVSPQFQHYLSLENRVTPQTPPAFIWATFADQAVPVENSLMLANALKAKNVPFELHIFPTGSHGLGLAQKQPGAASWPSLCVDWLCRLGF